MSAQSDEQAICGIIDAWLRASERGAVDELIPLMAEDVIFLRPGHEPMAGRQAFVDGFRLAVQHIRMAGQSDIREIRVAGCFAYCWNELSITITPVAGGEVKRHAGPVLSVFRKEADGRWVLFRDANMLTNSCPTRDEPEGSAS